MVRSRMMREMPREELSEWMVYSQLEPFGSWFNEYRSAMIAAASVAPHRKKGSRTPRPKDFMQDWGKTDKHQTAQQMVGFIRQFEADFKEKVAGAGQRVLVDPYGRPLK